MEEPTNSSIPLQQDASHNERTPPIGIKALILLYIAGVSIAAVSLFASRSQATTNDAFAAINYVILAGTFAFAVAVSVGLWRGAAWAWWIALFYHIWFGICVKLESLSGLGDDSAANANLLRTLSMLLLHVAITLFLLSPTVRRFFRVQAIATWKVVLSCIVTGFLVTILMAILIAVVAM